MAVPDQAKIAAAPSIITLLTDFGDRDHFVASMKGVMLSIHPAVRIVDLSNHIAPHQIDQAGYLLHACYRSFPEGTIHVCVVDPGVGSARRPLLVETARYYFLAPDNGLLTRILQTEDGVEIRQIENEQFRLRSEGSTFDGRDLFAPAAARLAKGEPVSSFGRVIRDPVTCPIIEPVWQGQSFIGQIEWVDLFGNLISNFSIRQLETFRTVTGRINPVISIAGHTIDKLVGSYNEGNPLSLQALLNSNGQIEIFLKGGSAARTINVGRGQQVILL